MFDNTNQRPAPFKSTIIVARLEIENVYYCKHNAKLRMSLVCTVFHDLPCGFPADEDLAREDNPELLRDEIRLRRKIQSRGRVSEITASQ